MKTKLKILLLGATFGSACEADVLVAKSDIGEDATSHTYMFYYAADRDVSDIVRVREVWNGGAGNPPSVTDYIIESEKLTIKVMKGSRKDIDRLIEGVDAPLATEQTMTVPRKGKAEDLDADVRHHIFELLWLLTQDRQAVPSNKRESLSKAGTNTEQAGAGQPATRPESKSEGIQKPQPESEERSR